MPPDSNSIQDKILRPHFSEKENSLSNWKNFYIKTFLWVTYWYENMVNLGIKV